jgi:hypothetical protein
VVVQNKKITRLKWMLSGYRQIYIIAACFIELAQCGRISFGDKWRIKLLNPDPTRISYLDEMLGPVVC